MLPALIISLITALLTGAAIFMRIGGGRDLALEIIFGLSVAIFLGTLLIVIVRKAALTIDEWDDGSGDGSPDTRDKDRPRR